MEYIDRHKKAAIEEAERRDALGQKGRNAENARDEAELLETKAQYNAAQQKLSQLPPNEKAALEAKKEAEAAKLQRKIEKMKQQQKERQLKSEQEAREMKKSREIEQQTAFNAMQNAYFQNRDARRRKDSGLPPLPLNNTHEGGRRKRRTLRKHKRRTHKRTLRKHKCRTHRR